MPWTLIKDVAMLTMPPEELCGRRYEGHPHGCPNLGKKPGCPPHALTLGQVIDLSKPVFAVWVVFDLEKHVERMRGLHPNWSKRQLECCLYWQPGQRAKLLDEINVWRQCHAFTGYAESAVALPCPESTGVDVTQTMERIGVHLQWPPVSVIHLVAIVGQRR